MSQHKDFHLRLTITQKERSKDSNTTVEHWEIQSGTLDYSIHFSGRRGPNQQNARKSVDLSTSQLEEVQQLLESKDLYQNIPSPKYSEFKTPHVATEVSLTSHKGTESYQIQLYELSKLIRENEHYRHMLTLKKRLDQFLEK